MVKDLLKDFLYKHILKQDSFSLSLSTYFQIFSMLLVLDYANLHWYIYTHIYTRTQTIFRNEKKVFLHWCKHFGLRMNLDHHRNWICNQFFPYYFKFYYIKIQQYSMRGTKLKYGTYFSTCFLYKEKSYRK